MTTRAPTTAYVGTGREAQPPQQLALRRQSTRLAAAPKVAPIAIAHPSSDGVKNWIGLERLVLDLLGRQRVRRRLT